MTFSYLKRFSGPLYKMLNYDILKIYTNYYMAYMAFITF